MFKKALLVASIAVVSVMWMIGTYLLDIGIDNDVWRN